MGGKTALDRQVRSGFQVSVGSVLVAYSRNDFDGLSFLQVRDGDRNSRTVESEPPVGAVDSDAVGLRDREQDAFGKVQFGIASHERGVLQCLGIAVAVHFGVLLPVVRVVGHG